MDSTHRITRMSNLLYRLCSALLVLSPLAVLAALAYGWAAVAGLPIRFPGLPPETVLTPAKAIQVTALGSLSLLPMVAMVWHMRQLFGHYRHADILSAPCAHHIKRIGQALITLCLMMIFLPTLQILLLTHDNPPGTAILSIGIDGAMLGLGLAGALFVIIGRVMHAAMAEIEGFV